jgi:uncharacterized membrane protein YhaH (DUF805 family)
MGRDSCFVFLFTIPVMLIAAVRRSHDLGRSGWFALICLIPFAGWYLVFKPGNPGANKYGPSPKGDVDVGRSPTSDQQ